MTSTLLSRSSKTQLKLRLVQLAQGCRPEHLIFCRRHREHLHWIVSPLKIPWRLLSCLYDAAHDPSKTYAFDDRLEARRCSLEFEFAMVCDLGDYLQNRHAPGPDVSLCTAVTGVVRQRPSIGMWKGCCPPNDGQARRCEFAGKALLKTRDIN